MPDPGAPYAAFSRSSSRASRWISYCAPDDDDVEAGRPGIRLSKFATHAADV